MITTDSLGLYQSACAYSKQAMQLQQGRHGSRKNSSHISTDMEAFYVQIISTMFYEIVTRKNTELLSYLCAVNHVCADTTHFSLFHKQCPYKSTYDLLGLIHGLNIAFSENLDECRRLYTAQYKNDMFQDKVFAQGFDYTARISEELVTLDRHLERLLSSAAPQNADVLKPKNTPEEKNAIVLDRHDPKLTDKFNQYAEERRANDSALLDQIQQLQVSLQGELKQIMSIREGIDYNTIQEAINQFISLHTLISETLPYHPNTESEDGYQDLIDSCEDFLANIEQSLSMLGVSIINDAGQIFTPERHKAVQGSQIVRGSVIAKVKKIGFIYKDKVLERAEVELVQS